VKPSFGHRKSEQRTTPQKPNYFRADVARRNGSRSTDKGGSITILREEVDVYRYRGGAKGKKQDAEDPKKLARHIP